MMDLDAEFADRRTHIAVLQASLASAVAAECPGLHGLIQHRDHRQPWCNHCGRDEEGKRS